MSSKITRRKPYEEVYEIADLRRDSADDSMENSIIQIEECYEDELIFGAQKATGGFYTGE